MRQKRGKLSTKGYLKELESVVILLGHVGQLLLAELKNQRGGDESARVDQGVVRLV